MVRPRLPFTGILILIPLAQAVITPNICVPSFPPDGSFKIDPSFPNFAFEFASLLNFAQAGENDTSPNQYSINLLNNVYKRTGGHPIVRIGGTSADYTLYRHDQIEPVLPIPCFGHAQNNTDTTIGPNFWPLTKNLASTNATWIPQISLATNNLSDVAELAKAAVNGIGMDRIDSIEPGNEPNLYPLTELGPPKWVGRLNNSQYADRFKEYAKVIATAIVLPNDSRPIFVAGDPAANLANFTDYPFNIPSIFQAGINTDNNIISVGAHFYQIATGGTLRDLMNHSSLVTHMAIQKSWAEYLRDSYNISLTMDEVNVLSGSPNVTVQSSLGSALWRTDYFLYCMTIGIKRVSYESVFGSNQSMWQSYDSNGSPAQTRGGYYSYLPAADFIGNTGGNTVVTQLGVDGHLDDPKIIEYAAYNKRELSRMAIVNFHQWSREEGLFDRPVTNITLSGINVKKVTVKYLNHPDGAAGLADGITYGGSQWTAESMGEEVKGVANDTLVVWGANGQIHVPVPWSSVAVVFVK